MLVLLALCWLMLALCWLMLDQVGWSWLMLAQVGPSWPQDDASMLAQVGLKMPNMASQGLQQAKFPRFLIQNCSFWNTQKLQNVKKKHLFYRSVCNLHFSLFRDAFWFSKLAQVHSKLAHVGLLEQIGVQVEPSWHQVGSSLAQVGLRKKAFLSEEKSSWRQVGPKSVPEGPRCLSQRVYTSTHLTFIIEHTNSPNFHQRTGGLRGAKVASKTFQNDPKSTPKANPNDPQKILSAFQFWFVCFKYVTHQLT